MFSFISVTANETFARTESWYVQHCHLYSELFEFETRSFVILFLFLIGSGIFSFSHAGETGGTLKDRVARNLRAAGKRNMKYETVGCTHPLVAYM